MCSSLQTSTSVKEVGLIVPCMPLAVTPKAVMTAAVFLGSVGVESVALVGLESILHLYMEVSGTTVL